jgi:tryptophan synthase alpha chain
VEGGADILEIGVPFSDPIADGPTIQRASERALSAGMTLRQCLELAGELRSSCETPIALMGYLNPVLAYGQREFFEECARHGVDAVIFPDLPPEEAQELCSLALANRVGMVFLLAPTSTPERLEAAFKAATAFVYFVSVTGVTGARAELPAELSTRLDLVRAESPVPLVVGFGISTPKQVKALAPHVDGVVVGSAIVSQIAKPGTIRERTARVKRLVTSLSSALGT